MIVDVPTLIKADQLTKGWRLSTCPKTMVSIADREAVLSMPEDAVERSMPAADIYR